jgi:hypothetical protein
METEDMQQHLTDASLLPVGAGTVALPRPLQERLTPGLAATLVARVWNRLAAPGWRAESEGRLSRYSGGRI